MQPPAPKFDEQVPVPAKITLDDGDRLHPVTLYIDTRLDIFYGKLTDGLRPPVSESESDEPEPEAIPA